MKLSGVYVANFTPFVKSESLDLESYERHLAFLADAGIAGFVPCGTTGEAAVLSLKERELLLTATVSFAKTRKLPVLAGCGSNHTATALEYLIHAKSLGCDAALVVTPYYNRPTPAGVVAHYRFLSERSPLPIVAYHVPGRTNVFLSPETTSEIMALPNVVGLKEASGNHNHWLSLSTQPHFKNKALLAGDDDAMATIMALGGTGIISATANVAPRAFVALGKAFEQGNWPAAFAIQRTLLPLIKAMFKETNPAPVKKALELMGFGDGSLRLPLVPVGSDTETIIRAALKTIEALP